MKALAIVLLALGLVCIGMSFMWGRFSKPKVTEAELQEYAQLSEWAHGAPQRITEEERAEKKEKIKAIQNEFADSKKRVAKGTFRWRVAGILLAVVGVALQVWQNAKDG